MNKNIYISIAFDNNPNLTYQTTPSLQDLLYENCLILYKINLDVITIRITEILLLTELKEK